VLQRILANHLVYIFYIINFKYFDLLALKISLGYKIKYMQKGFIIYRPLF